MTTCSTAHRSYARRLTALAAGTVLVLAAVGMSLPAQAAVSPVTVVFDYTGVAQPFTVPESVTSITVTAAGGRGGPSPYDIDLSGGRGATVTATLGVTPGAMLTVVVAGDAGSAGNTCHGLTSTNCGGFGAGNGGSQVYGGGGGGGSAVRGADGSTLVTAGGGGGAGASDNCFDRRAAGGNGGDAGFAGDKGADCTGPGFVVGGGGGGGAGTTTAPGAGGAGGTAQPGGACTRTAAGLPGQPGAGGDGAGTTDDVVNTSGAGGGGWRGGGTGGDRAFSGNCDARGGPGGGGGGSIFVVASATGTTTGFSTRAFGQNGQVTITYTPVVTGLTLSPAAASVAAGADQAYTVTGSTSAGPADVTTESILSIAPSSGGSATGAACTGNRCSAQIAGTYTVTAVRGNLTATASLTVTAGAATTVMATSGSGQSATTGTAFASPLMATVTDAYGNPVSGAAVTFAVDPSSTGTATVSGSPATTGANGQASATLTAGSTAGPVTVTASSGTGSAAFLETVTAAGPARADLTVTLDGPSTVKSGGSATLTVTVKNTGPSASGRYAAAIFLPRQLTPTSLGGGTRYGSVVIYRGTNLASGASVSYTVSVAARGKGSVSYAGAAMATTTDPRLANNLAVRSLSIS